MYGLRATSSILSYQRYLTNKYRDTHGEQQNNSRVDTQNDLSSQLNPESSQNLSSISTDPDLTENETIKNMFFRTGKAELSIPEDIREKISAFAAEVNPSYKNRIENPDFSDFFTSKLRDCFSSYQPELLVTSVVRTLPPDIDGNPQFHIDGRNRDYPEYPFVRILIVLDPEQAGTLYLDQEDKRQCDEIVDRDIIGSVVLGDVPKDKIKQANPNKALMVLGATKGLPQHAAYEVFRRNSLGHASPAGPGTTQRYVLRMDYVLFPKHKD